MKVSKILSYVLLVIGIVYVPIGAYAMSVETMNGGAYFSIGVVATITAMIFLKIVE